jgi:hypothetical protein
MGATFLYTPEPMMLATTTEMAKPRPNERTRWFFVVSVLMREAGHVSGQDKY